MLTKGVLQVTSDDTMRLLTVIDHPYCLFMVAMMAATLEHLGLKMDLSQAIVAPYVEGNNVTGSPSANRPAQETAMAWRWSRWP